MKKHVWYVLVSCILPLLGACAIQSNTQATASLTDTYWRVTQVGGQAIDHGDFTREPHLVLHSDQSRVSGTTGCNNLLGQFDQQGPQLDFSKLGSTRMMCTQSVMKVESAMLQALGDTDNYDIQGNQLTFYNAQHQPVAQFQAIAMD